MKFLYKKLLENQNKENKQETINTKISINQEQPAQNSEESLKNKNIIESK